MQVSLIAGFAGGSPNAGPLPDSLPDAPTERDATAVETSNEAGSTAAQPDQPATAETQAAARPPSRSAIAPGQTGQAADAFDGTAGTSNARGGDPLATSDLLAQIARCLPAGQRPNLAFSQLTLAIGPDGRLRTAPEVTSQLPRLAASERAAADRIVQAALLCGPYAHPDLRGRTVSVAADFSAVAPPRS